MIVIKRSANRAMKGKDKIYNLHVPEDKCIGIGKAHEHQNRRSAFEAVIGHMKTDALLSRNRLQGREGDRINALLCGAGQKLYLILKKLRLLFWLKRWTALYTKLVSCLKSQVDNANAVRLPSIAAACT